ncbi:MAG TPA: membrane dipeptidase [Chloroflexia bacterium]|nr:membrane dipeptidase [Chloroflexia bacterium]
MNQQFLESLFIVDSHQDIAWNASLGRDFFEPAASWRSRVNDGEKYGERLVTLPDLLASQVRLVIGTIFVLPERAASKWEGYYTSLEEAHQQGLAQLNFYKELARRDSRVKLIRTPQELDEHIRAVEAGAQALGIIISMEGADPITEPDQLGEWVEQGLRLIGPAWKETIYCGGTGEPGPLKPAGYRLLAEMQRQGVILDVSHMAEETFYNALDAYRGTIIASHSNCRHIVNTDRQLSDDMIRRLVEREAVIGVVLYDRFLAGANASRKSNLEDVIRHMSHLCEIAGHTQCIALGTDWDGGFGGEAIPEPLTGLKDLPLLAEALLRNGFSENDVRGIFYGNWLRILRRGLAPFAS